MIKLDSITIENQKTAYLIFSNENGKRVAIPVPHTLGKLISTHLRLLSTDPVQIVERGNEDKSD